MDSQVLEQTAAPATPTTQQIPIDKIVPSPFQARKNFDEPSLKELAQTIKDRGLENAILVRPVGDQYELIAGERRWRAVKSLGWQTIEAKVEAVDDKEAFLRGLIENVQREDLSPIEKALGYRNLTQPPFNLNQSEVADMVGKDRTVVSRYVNVAKLGDTPEGVHACTPLALNHLLELNRVPDHNDQIALATEVAKKGLSAGQLKALVDQKVGPKKAKSKASAKQEPDGPTAEVAGDDPLTNIWQPMLMESMGSGKFWGVTYGPQQIPGMKEASIPAWHFWVPNNGMTPKGDLKAWFLKMAEAMGDTDQESKQVQTMMTHWTPASQQEVEQIMHDMGNLRLPQNPEESAELEKLTDQGPEAVYAWIYGKDSFYSKKAQGLTWQDLGVKDPKAGLQKTVNDLTLVQQLQSEHAEKPSQPVPPQPEAQQPTEPDLGNGAGQLVADVAKNLLGQLF